MWNLPRYDWGDIKNAPSKDRGTGNHAIFPPCKPTDQKGPNRRAKTGSPYDGIGNCRPGNPDYTIHHQPAAGQKRPQSDDVLIADMPTRSADGSRADEMDMCAGKASRMWTGEGVNFHPGNIDNPLNPGPVTDADKNRATTGQPYEAGQTIKKLAASFGNRDHRIGGKRIGIDCRYENGRSGRIDRGNRGKRTLPQSSPQAGLNHQGANFIAGKIRQSPPGI